MEVSRILKNVLVELIRKNGGVTDAKEYLGRVDDVEMEVLRDAKVYLGRSRCIEMLGVTNAKEYSAG